MSTLLADPFVIEMLQQILPLDCVCLAVLALLLPRKALK